METRFSQSGHAASVSNEAFVPTVLDRITDGVLLSDGDGVIVFTNKPLQKLFGYSTSDLVGHYVEVLLPDDMRAEHRHHVRRFFTSPEPRPMGRDDLDIEGRRADGTLFPIDVELNPLPDSSLVVATVRDMTAQRNASVESAIAKIDLANARAQIGQLGGTLDLVIQRLFALGISLTAGAANMTTAVRRIDEIIEAVQQTRSSAR